ncbi:MAG: ABC transporter permease [Acidobacteriia bacterium]|nr:ABC transporter permease [Terriglobia bacterium]
METVLQDLRYGLRTLWKSPRFTVTAVITLAVGIAANVAIFTFVDATLIRPLPYKDSQQLVAIYDTREQTVASQFEASYPDYLDWKQQNQVFSSIAGYGGGGTVLRGEGAPVVLPSAVVSDDFFSTLGVKPILGRDFQPGEDLASAPETTILSYGFWQKHFGGKRDVIGRVVTLGRSQVTIIGVLPANFHFAPVADPDLWQTLHATDGLRDRRNLHWLNVVARLKPGVSQEKAAAGMKVVMEGLERQYPASNTKLRTALVPLNEVIVGQIRPILLLLLGAVALLLMIACSNVANLLLARALSRRREVAVRTALGASRWRLVRQMLTEGILLSLTGATLGVVLAEWMVRGFVAAIPQALLNSMPYIKMMTIDWSVLLFALVVALLTGVLFALAPAFQLSGKHIHDAFRDGARGSQSAGWRRFASSLVVAEVAVSMVLLFGAGVLGKSFYRLLQVDTGFNYRNLTSMAVVMPSAQYKTDAQQIAFYRTLMDRLQSLPGVQSAGITSTLPIGQGNTSNVVVVGQPFTGQGFEANRRSVDTHYFQTLQAQLLAGRWFNESDNAQAPQRVIVNKTFADMFMKGLDPVVQQVRFTYSDKEKPREVIGVVRDIKEAQLDAAPLPAIYTPYLQDASSFLYLVVRSQQDAAASIPQTQAAIRQLDSNVVTFQEQSMEDFIQRSPVAFFHRYPAWLAGLFAVMALVLGSIGLYGLVAYSVSQRTQEIGIRMALGAQRSNVLQMVLLQGVRLIVPGVVIGMAGGIAAATLARSLLFQVNAWDPAIFAIVTVLLAAVTLAASFIPARTATKVDPMVALRYE